MNKRERILIVDDEVDARTFLFSLLDNEGYLVATASNGIEALKYVARERPRLVISDVRMPEMEGLELLAKIKYAAPDTAVILLSAYADWPLFFDALGYGGSDVLLKPCRNEDLLRAVERALEKAETGGER